jgi:hypothetical protein
MSLIDLEMIYPGDQNNGMIRWLGQNHGTNQPRFRITETLESGSGRLNPIIQFYRKLKGGA